MNAPQTSRLQPGRGNRVLRGGRLVKWKGRVVSLAPWLAAGLMVAAMAGTAAADDATPSTGLSGPVPPAQAATVFDDILGPGTVNGPWGAFAGKSVQIVAGTVLTNNAANNCVVNSSPCLQPGPTSLYAEANSTGNDPTLIQNEGEIRWDGALNIYVAPVRILRSALTDQHLTVRSSGTITTGSNAWINVYKDGAGAWRADASAPVAYAEGGGDYNPTGTSAAIWIEAGDNALFRGASGLNLRSGRITGENGAPFTGTIEGTQLWGAWFTDRLTGDLANAGTITGRTTYNPTTGAFLFQQGLHVGDLRLRTIDNAGTIAGYSGGIDIGAGGGRGGMIVNRTTGPADSGRIIGGIKVDSGSTDIDAGAGSRPYLTIAQGAGASIEAVSEAILVREALVDGVRYSTPVALMGVDAGGLPDPSQPFAGTFRALARGAGDSLSSTNLVVLRDLVLAEGQDTTRISADFIGNAAALGTTAETQFLFRVGGRARGPVEFSGDFEWGNYGVAGAFKNDVTFTGTMKNTNYGFFINMAGRDDGEESRILVNGDVGDDAKTVDYGLDVSRSGYSRSNPSCTDGTNPECDGKPEAVRIEITAGTAIETSVAGISGIAEPFLNSSSGSDGLAITVKNAGIIDSGVGFSNAIGASVTDTAPAFDNTGEIYGRTEAAISIRTIVPRSAGQDPIAVIRNSGRIEGATQGLLLGENWDADARGNLFRVENTGSISGDIAVQCVDRCSIVISGGGTITGTAFAILSESTDSSNVFSYDDYVGVRASSSLSASISGTISTNAGNDLIENDHIIDGAIDMGAGNDRLSNTGSIAGDIDMGDGDDVVDYVLATDDEIAAGGADSGFGTLGGIIDGGAHNNPASPAIGGDTVLFTIKSGTRTLEALPQDDAGDFAELRNFEILGKGGDGRLILDIRDTTGNPDTLFGQRWVRVHDSGTLELLSNLAFWDGADGYGNMILHDDGVTLVNRAKLHMGPGGGGDTDDPLFGDYVKFEGDNATLQNLGSGAQIFDLLIDAHGSGFSLVNEGTIALQDEGEVVIKLHKTGSVENRAGASITGSLSYLAGGTLHNRAGATIVGNYTIEASCPTGTVCADGFTIDNAGTIRGLEQTAVGGSGDDDAVNFYSLHGAVTNRAGATIDATRDAIYISWYGSSETDPTRRKIDIVNEAGATIAANTDGGTDGHAVVSYDDGVAGTAGIETVDNAGEINGTIALGHGNDRVILRDTGEIDGGVDLGAGDDLLEVYLSPTDAAGGTITGSATGGAGLDTVTYSIASGSRSLNQTPAGAPSATSFEGIGKGGAGELTFAFVPETGEEPEVLRILAGRLILDTPDGIADWSVITGTSGSSDAGKAILSASLLADSLTELVNGAGETLDLAGALVMESGTQFTNRNGATLTATGIAGSEGTQTVVNESGATISPAVTLGAGNDRVVNRFGFYQGAIDLGAGDDILEVYLDGNTGAIGGSIAGTPDGGEGFDTIVYSLVSGEFRLTTLPALNPDSGLVNFEAVGKGGGGNLVFAFGSPIATKAVTIEGAAAFENDVTATITDGVAQSGLINLTESKQPGALETVLTNRATITAARGLSMAGATRFVNEASRTATVGTVGLVGDDGRQQIDNAGAIFGAIQLGAGNDILRLAATGTVSGTSTGGDGDGDELEIDAGALDGRTISSGDFGSFEKITLNPTGSANGRFTIADGAGGVTLDTGGGTSTTITLARGELKVRDSTSSVRAETVTAVSGTVVSGNGTIVGATTTLEGTVSPGNSVGHLTIAGNLALAPTSLLAFELGAANVVGGFLNDLITVTGSLVLDGQLTVAESAGGSFTAGVYRLIDYGGTLTDNILDIAGALPNGLTGVVQTTIANQVNLVVAGGGTVDVGYWDGPNTTPGNIANGRGGTATWDAGTTNWTTATGDANGPWDAGVGVFAGTTGTVTVVGTQAFAGLQFVTDDYLLLPGASGALDLGTGAFIHVDAGLDTSISVGITGTGALDKQGDGRLVLDGTGSYVNTTVSAGTLAVGSQTALGSGSVSLADGTTLEATTDLTLANAVAVNAPGTTTATIDTGTSQLTLSSALTGGTDDTVRKSGTGTLTLAAGGSIGRIEVAAGWLENGAALTLPSGLGMGDGSAGTTTRFSNLTGATADVGSSGITGDAGIQIVANDGAITGGIDLGDGDDTLTLTAAATVSLASSGGAGRDTLDLDAGSGGRTLNEGQFTGFEAVTLNPTASATGAFTIGAASAPGTTATLDTGGGPGTTITLSRGTLTLNDTTSSLRAETVTIDPDARLNGIGRVFNGTGSSFGPSSLTSVAGTISPGSAAIGTLRIVGHYSQTGRYELDYRAPADTGNVRADGALWGRNAADDATLPDSAQDADLILVEGTGTLSGGTVVLRSLGGDFDAGFAAPGNTAGKIRYLVLRASDGLGGTTFAALSSADVSLEYADGIGAGEPTDVILVVSGDAPVVIPTAPPTTAREGALWSGVVADRQKPRCDLEIGGVSLTGRCAFANGQGIIRDVDGSTRGAGFETTEISGLIGGGWRVATDVAALGVGRGDLWLGVAAGYGSLDLDAEDAQGDDGDADRFDLYLWGQYREGPADLRAWTGFSHYGISGSRETALGDWARSDYDAWAVSIAAEGRWWFDLDAAAPGRLQASPLIGLGFVHLDREGYTETGGGVENFRAEGTTVQSLRSFAGAEARWRPQVAGVPGRVEITGWLGWEHEFADTSSTLSGAYTADAAGTRFAARSADTGRDFVSTGVSAAFALDDATALRIGYGGSFNDRSTNHSVFARLSIGF